MENKYNKDNKDNKDHKDNKDNKEAVLPSIVFFPLLRYNDIASRNAGLDYGSLVGLVQWEPVNRVRIER